MTNSFVFEADLAAKTIYISREFSAPIEKVWSAFAAPELVDKWIAPKPWKAETKVMEFTVGGIWLYAMVGPDGQKHWTRIEFTAIEIGSAFLSTNMFSDEDGNTAEGAAKSYTTTKFISIDSKTTKVDIVKTFTHEATIKMFVQMGFKEGTLAGYQQLDELLLSE